MRGILAAWAADEFSLRHDKEATAQLDGLANSGALNAVSSADTPADPHAYVVALLNFLRKRGYH